MLPDAGGLFTGRRSPAISGAEPMSGNFQLGADPFGSVHEVNAAAELVGYQLTNYAGPEA